MNWTGILLKKKSILNKYLKHQIIIIHSVDDLIHYFETIVQLELTQIILLFKFKKNTYFS